MNSMKALSHSQIESERHRISDWKLNGKFIERNLEFKDFKEAFAFMTNVAGLAEQMNHHPDWSNVYNKVNIRLTTHDAEGITSKDFELAEKIDLLLKNSGKETA